MLDDRIPGELNKKQSEYVSNVLKSGTHLIELINDILDLSKMESGEMKLDKIKFRIEDVLKSAVTTLKPAADKKSIAISTDIQVCKSEIYADRLKIKDILLNLLSNAVKFTPEGGNISIDITCNGNNIQVTVSDTGIGIPENDLPMIFEPFKQIDSFMTREIEGTGMGLAIVKRYVEMHDGNIFVQSIVGKGSIFTCMIPFVDSYDK